MPGNPRMNNFRNNMSTSELNTQTLAECDVMSAHDLISMLLERSGDFFSVDGNLIPKSQECLLEILL